MNRKVLQLGLLTGLLFTSCQKDESSETDFQEQQFKTNTSEEELQQAIKFDETGVIGVSSPDLNRDASDVALFAIEQIGYLEAPVINNTALHATHVDVRGDFAYVSYNKEGATYMGAIDIVDVSNKYEPRLVSRMKTDYADINSLYVDATGTIVFTGASENGGDNGNFTLLGFVNTANGNFSSDFSIDEGISGYAGVHVFEYHDNTVFLSGANGIAGALKNFTTAQDFSSYREFDQRDIRYGEFNGESMAMLSGEGKLMNISLDDSDFNELSSISISNLTPESKRTLTWYGDNVIISQGGQGAGIYNFSSNTELANLPLKMHPDATFVSEGDKVTNAVSTDGNFVYMANGGAGLDILKLDSSFGTIGEGIAEISGSANFVQAKGEYIYLASGTGLHILRILTSDDTAVSDSFLDCESYDIYTGDKNLTIPSDVEVSYSGLVNLKHLNVNGTLNVCGDLIVEKSTNLASQSSLNMNGNFTLGNQKNSENLVINSDSKLKISGNMTIYGDLYISSGGILEFVGDDSSIYVTGEVKINSGGMVTGTFEDQSDKFD
ncbi:MAG: hypothetical protein ABGW97_11670 [Christiangramia sp.]|uniref:hypothetical protein n=1 Tax=Christiangramia sp. TaxID=1931228 RepID=UPI0032427EF0